MNQKTLAESIKSLIKNGILNEEFMSSDLLSLKKTDLLKQFKQSSLQTHAANASLSHPDAGDLGIGVPVKRGEQTPHFWRVRKEGRSLVFALISEAERPLVASLVSQNHENTKP